MTLHFQEPIEPKTISGLRANKKTLMPQSAERKKNKSYLQNVSEALANLEWREVNRGKSH